ncbi:adapter protein MecA 1/2 [Thermolongibacillus altinsuensis]|uniref:Adapter protein MecA n=1 Tax=Thermolongibacillus altinsuensis TaxID=575256 RepID=A0A4R1QHV0_9BACL|nr:genetic competence negative regulator [Thermolongibacillus altinsuensis]TCL53138.1 adapter protein MecA 1/2 [Thermolongibacillus altinsuensis]GMB07841.1 adapter protein MecA [Thermolongibacillus altinsuensis]
MRLERLNYNKIKIFLTFDDLVERGLTKEDLWKDTFKVHQLFRDMIDEASEELGFEINGSVAVEVYSLPAQGMVVIVTSEGEMTDEEDDEFSDDYIEMQVTLDESDDIFFEFRTLEDVIQLAERLYALGCHGGSLYSYEGRFYLYFEEPTIDTDDFVAILAEYGSPSTLTIHRVQEYGKKLMEDQAIAQIYQYFVKK